MDRFNEQDPMDYGRDSREAFDNWDGPECGCRFSGDIADASRCELHGMDAADWNAGRVCLKRQLIVEWSDSTKELAAELARHDAECSICSPSSRTVKSDGARESGLRRAA